MPRKSTASTSGPADIGAASATSSSHAPSNLDGETVMPVATETSPSSKPHKTSTKGDADGTGIDVSSESLLDSKTHRLMLTVVFLSTGHNCIPDAQHVKSTPTNWFCPG